ncbi:Abi-like protein [Mycolicibacterium chubuense NBB4]|uniref:Abi-like protein n=1 Tax=Mycolicibacterium chubuense (strain NBB4) TaxID=710421 RepID=I4BMT5_MYCCN|nr:Abi-like protein [Mycolicibacterium chubuense]AFM18592.1 Abi-like protein [Mycolicibacterium chubuense NBB4]
MPERILPLLGTARVGAYEAYRPHYSQAQLGELYAWHSSLASAVHEVLGYCEVVFRNALDKGLAEWNGSHPTSPGGPHWLLDPAPQLKAIIDPPPPPPPKPGEEPRKQGRRVVFKARTNVIRSRDRTHRRFKEPITHDDLLAQLTFGELVHLVPTNSSKRVKGFTPIEMMWLYGVRSAFPNVDKVFPLDTSLKGNTALVDQGRRLGDAADRLRILRNRIAHHEQILTAKHAQRHRDALLIVEAVSTDAAAALSSISRVLDLIKREP